MLRVVDLLPVDLPQQEFVRFGQFEENGLGLGLFTDVWMPLKCCLAIRPFDFLLISSCADAKCGIWVLERSYHLCKSWKGKDCRKVGCRMC